MYALKFTVYIFIVVKRYLDDIMPQKGKSLQKERALVHDVHKTPGLRGIRPLSLQIRIFHGMSDIPDNISGILQPDAQADGSGAKFLRIEIVPLLVFPPKKQSGFRHAQGNRRGHHPPRPVPPA
jgi:hypothetical protein